MSKRIAQSGFIARIKVVYDWITKHGWDALAAIGAVSGLFATWIAHRSFVLSKASNEIARKQLEHETIPNLHVEFFLKIPRSPNLVENQARGKVIGRATNIGTVPVILRLGAFRLIQGNSSPNNSKMLYSGIELDYWPKLIQPTATADLVASVTTLRTEIELHRSEGVDYLVLWFTDILGNDYWSKPVEVGRFRIEIGLASVPLGEEMLSESDEARRVLGQL